MYKICTLWNLLQLSDKTHWQVISHILNCYTKNILQSKSFTLKFHECTGSLYLITVEDQHLSPKQTTHGLHRFCLPSTCRTIGISSQPHVHTCNVSRFCLWNSKYWVCYTCKSENHVCSFDLERFFCDKTVITMYVQQNKGIFWSLTLCECQVALVCQWGVYQFSSIALVLVSVLKLSIHHLYATQAFSVHVESAIYQAITPDYTIWNFHT